MPSSTDLVRNTSNHAIIEDAACAIGAFYKGVEIGSHSDLECFSFHPRKVVTTGDGGMKDEETTYVVEEVVQVLNA